MINAQIAPHALRARFGGDLSYRGEHTIIIPIFAKTHTHPTHPPTHPHTHTHTHATHQQANGFCLQLYPATYTFFGDEK